jgi:hypothetical protein
MTQIVCVVFGREECVNVKSACITLNMAYVMYGLDLFPAGFFLGGGEGRGCV